mgnify:CR=1 FL=1
MTNKEIGELRRRMKPDRTNLTAVYGCYVASSGEVLSTFREPFGLMAEEDKEKYLAIFRRALSGTPDRNLLDLSFSTKQVADSDEHRLLMRLRETALDDEQARQQLFQTIIGAVSFEENYLILLAHERYDVPFKARDGARLEDGSEVFSYFVCAICPVKPGKELLSYIAEEKTFHNRSAGRAAGMPEMGFLFPAFDGRRTNLYNCLFYTHSSGADNQPLIDALFHVDPPMSAEEQKNAFGSALADALDKDCSYDVVQSVHEQIRARIEDHKESKDPEPLEMTAGDVGGILANSGVNDEQIAAFQRECDEQYGENAALNPNNIIESKKFEITTPEVKISIAPENSYMIEARVINGRKYLLIPADDGVEVNGIGVNIPGLTKDE